MADYKGAVEYLKTASTRGSRLGLERIRELCSLLGNPQESFRAIHVAGTNGKGSFCAMISAILCESGYKVGCFSSPALTGVTDSFRIDGEEISEGDFAEVMSDIIPVCESMDDKPTEFEVITAVAFELFRRRGCDIGVIECGMGGDGDSTNVIKSPLLSVITNVAVDHVSFLGGTVKEIAAHKAGIIKEGRPTVYGGNDPEALSVIEDVAERKKSPLSVADFSSVEVAESGFSGIEIIYRSERYRINLVGEYQPYNAMNVLNAVDVLRSEGVKISGDNVKKGFLSARIRGRFEVFSTEPPIIFDGSHNPDGIRKAAESLEKYFGERKVNLLIGVMADKDFELYPQILGKYVDRVYTVKPDNPRALDSKTLLLTFGKYGIYGATCDDLDICIKMAIEISLENGTPLVCLGSLYLYKDFVRNLNQYNLPS